MIDCFVKEIDIAERSAKLYYERGIPFEITKEWLEREGKFLGGNRVDWGRIKKLFDDEVRDNNR